MPTPTSGPGGTPSTAILAEITASLATGRNLHELLQRFLDPVVRLSGASGGAVRVLSEADHKLHLVSEVGAAGRVCQAQDAVDRHCGHCGAAADAAGVVWATDISACREQGAGAPIGVPPAQRLLAVPLQHRGRVLGVYSLFFGECEAPSADVQALLKSVGELLGLALENARLESENLRATLLHERQMMAADVHDTLAQSLAYVKMRLPLLHDAMLAHDDAHALQYYGDVRSEVSRAHASLRAILTHLRVPMDPHGLVHALGASAESFRRRTGAELEFVNDMPGLKLQPDQEAQVFHIVQEALSNVARHASAEHARLHIGTAAAGAVEIVVEDDGAGLPAAAAGGTHYGLEIMLERARRIGGTLEVGARQGGGTRVRLAFPLPAAGGP
jgi:two-component system nitrate/nitrite sensor histidine kinase NarX